MRVGRRVAVAWEVFGGGDDALALRALDEGGDEARHLRGVFAETADVDDGVRGVVVHVGDGREELLDAERAGLARRQLALSARVVGVSGRADGHVPRKVCRVVEAHAASGFEVC